MDEHSIQQKCETYFASRKGAGYCARCSKEIENYGEIGINRLFCPQCFTMWLNEFEDYLSLGNKTPERRQGTTIFEGIHNRLRAKHFSIAHVNVEDPPKIEEAKKESQVVMVKECCICLDEEKTMSFVPCGHLAICKKCHASKKWDKCPLCNQKCSTVIQIFM